MVERIESGGRVARRTVRGRAVRHNVRRRVRRHLRRAVILPGAALSIAGVVAGGRPAVRVGGAGDGPVGMIDMIETVAPARQVRRARGAELAAGGRWGRLRVAQANDSTPSAPTIFAPGVISGPANDLSPAFTPDGETVFFTRANSTQSTILVSHRSPGKWSTPTIASFSGEWRDLEPTMAPDGSYLVFVSNRPTVAGGRPLDGSYNGAAQPTKGGNLWRVDRGPGGGWEGAKPYRLPDVVNTNTSIYAPSVVADGSVYFMQPVTPGGKFHLFRAQRTGSTFAPPVEVPLGAGESVGDFDPAVAPDETFMVFSSSRLAEKGTSLFIAFRRKGVWGTPIYMGDVASVPGSNNIESRLGPDHRTLYFSSARVTPAPTPRDRATTEAGLARMAAWDNGLMNIWTVPLDWWLAHGPPPG